MVFGQLQNRFQIANDLWLALQFWCVRSSVFGGELGAGWGEIELNALQPGEDPNPYNLRVTIFHSVKVRVDDLRVELGGIVGGFEQ